VHADPHRILLLLPGDLWSRIVKVHEAEFMDSKTATVRMLLERGLAAYAKGSK
jgi:hypothetical protein